MRKTIFIGLLLLFVGVPAASAKLDRDVVKSWLRQELLARDIHVDNIAYCKPDGAKVVYRCAWHAQGEWEGDVPYECHGTARYDAKAREWWISRCKNRIPAEVPLRPEAWQTPLFGFNQEWLLNEELFDEAAGAGGHVVRQIITWAAVEKDPGEDPEDWKWGIFDDFYAEALAAGQKPLFILMNAPCWAQADPQACEHGDNRRHPSPSHYDDAGEFAREVTERYPELVGLEVWNEPNWRVFWGSDPDPRGWGRLVKAVANGVHAGDSDVPVVTGGPMPSGENKGTESNMPQSRFLARAYETGGPQAADAIGTHPYPYRAFNDEPVDYLDSVRAKLEEILAVMRRHGDAGKEIFITETGVSTDNGFTERQQGTALANIYRMLLRVDHPIPVVLFHTLADGDGSGSKHYGLIDSNGHFKPAYCAVAQALGETC